MPNPTPPPIAAAARQMYEAEAAYHPEAAIAAAVGIAPCTVRRLAAKFGWQRRAPRRLAYDQRVAVRIRELRGLGLTNVEIARALGITPAWVRRVLGRGEW